MDFFTFDDDYVRRLRARDARTEEHFAKYCRDMLPIILRKYVRSTNDMDDVVQETSIRVLEKVLSPDGGLRDNTKFGAFLAITGRNVALERARKRGRTEPFDDHRDDRADGEDDALTKLITAERKLQVRRVLNRLSPRDVAILRALFFDQRNKDELCRKEGISRSYLRVLLHRALEHFGKKFDAADETNDDEPSLGA
jgi:RNA polymerase sigma-70 factor (ECF subfamily)